MDITEYVKNLHKKNTLLFETPSVRSELSHHLPLLKKDENNEESIIPLDSPIETGNSREIWKYMRRGTTTYTECTTNLHRGIEITRYEGKNVQSTSTLHPSEVTRRFSSKKRMVCLCGRDHIVTNINPPFKSIDTPNQSF